MPKTARKNEKKLKCIFEKMTADLQLKQRL